MARSTRKAARATRSGLGLLLVLILAVGACLGGKPGPQASPTPAPLPAPQGLTVFIGTPTPLPNVVARIGDPVVVEGLLLRALALQLPEVEGAAAGRYAIVQVAVQHLEGPAVLLAPQAQMLLEDQDRARIVPERPLNSDQDLFPFWLGKGEERLLRLGYQLPAGVQRVRWLFLPAGAAAPALTVDFGPLPPGHP